MSEMQFVRYEVEEHVATLTIDRPDKLNALDGQVLGELGEALGRLATDKAVRCLILTGVGKAFVAGADIAAMQGMSPAEAEGFSRQGHSVFAAIESLPFPTIAAVNGFALGGGCELALACDFIYASSKARFGQPEVKLGVIPGFGGTQRLARRVGVGQARELIYTGAMFKADVAKDVGLVNRVCEPDALLPQARETAQTIAAQGPRAVEAAKRLLLAGPEMSLPEANGLEAVAFGKCFETEDQREGMRAFLAREEPNFKGQ